MRLRSADDDVTDMTSQLVSSGRRLADVDAAGRWIADHSDQYVSVLTIVNATHRDAGLFVCYDVTSARRSAFHVFHVIVTDDQPPSEGLFQFQQETQCCREVARCFVLLIIFLSHSR